MKLCPKCKRPMPYAQRGVRADWAPAMGWRCSRCWITIYDGEKPWALTLSRADWVKYVMAFGYGPSEWEGRPDNWERIQAAFTWPPVVQLSLL